MTGDARSLKATVPETFDLDSQTGILFVLRAIRVASISQTDKNTLKDLVFLYNTSTKDASIQQKLGQSLHELGVTPAVVAQVAEKEAQKVEPVPPASGFSVGRLSPLFGVPSGVAQSMLAQPLPETSPVSTQPVAVATPVIPQNQINENAIPVRKIAPNIPQPPRPVVPIALEPRIVKVSVPTPAPVPDQAPIDVIPVKSLEQVLPVLVPTPAPLAPAPIVTPEAVNISAATQRMERIRTIKSTINDRIGNPVNLVDVDNALGREYMSALLEAMKLLSSASDAESAQAMNRLEAVNTQVLMLLDTIEEQKQTPVQTPVQTTATVTSPTLVSAPVITPITPVITIIPVTAPVIEPVPTPVERITPVARIVPTAPPALPAPTLPTPDFAIRSKIVDKPQTVTPPVNNWGAREVTDSVSSVSEAEIISSVANRVTPPDEITVNRLSTPPAEPLREVKSVSVPSYQPEAVQSVTEQATPLRNLSELKTADEVSAIEAIQNNPLYTKDVDAGLEQLLSEWSIFKKSGLFGTGPKGREHPLYAKINGMHLPLILAGRFEGSTQEIKQSITDYMNGWRYEQGIVYDQGETLDQYLRRVIRHIIDLQKSKRRS